MLHILKLDSLGSDVARDYETLYADLLRGGGYSGAIKHYEPRLNDYPQAVDDGDTVLIGGSRLDAFAQDEFTLRLVEYTRELLANESIRLIGVCYGHQIIARALGAEVVRREWEVGVCSLQLTAAGEQIFSEIKYGDGLEQSHLDQVVALPEGAVLLAKTRQCQIQAFGWRSRVLCVQGHPEFSLVESNLCLDRISLKDAAAAAEGRKTVNLPHVGPKFGYAFARLAM